MRQHFLLDSLRRSHRDAALIAIALGLSACAFAMRGENSMIGGSGGGAAGVVVGNEAGSTARGAILGAVVGGDAGVTIGHQMDQQATELKQSVPSATVERVAEGIQVTFASGALYDVNSDHLSAKAATNLRNLASSLGKFPNTDLLIVGHTDEAGTAGNREGLSQRRAAAAAAYLITEGVSVNRVRTAGRAAIEPIAPNATESGRQQNRRVEVAIFANASAKRRGAY
jgi:outer membrane protein OmpA-like peptidoglycan-associated protein